MSGSPELLGAHHDTSFFMCGEPGLDQWLQRRAMANQTAGTSRTYVIANDSKVVGYYCLAAGAIASSTATGRVRRNCPNPVPVMVLGRLAVDVSCQGCGFGKTLLRDAVLRTLQAADIIGCRALLVHALHEKAARFYEGNGFQRSPINPLVFMIRLDDARAALGIGKARP